MLFSAKLYKAALLLLALYTGWLIYSNIITHPLARWDEQTNAQVVEEWVNTPSPALTLNQAPFFEKPPFWYYLTGISSAIFGLNPVSVRLVSVISTAMLICCAFFLGRLLKSRFFGLSFWIVLLAIPLLWWQDFGAFNSHTLWSADLDSLYYLLIFAGCTLAVAYLKRHSAWYAYWAALLFALALLTKGPLVLIFLAGFLLLLLLRKDRRTALRVLLIFLVIILPWHILMTALYGNAFWDSYLGYHFISRVTTVIESHYEPATFYLSLFFSLKLNPVWPVLLFSGWLGARKRNKTILLLHLLVPLLLILISLIQTRLAWYIFPVLLLESVCIATLALTLDKAGGKALQFY